MNILQTPVLSEKQIEKLPYTDPSWLTEEFSCSLSDEFRSANFGDPRRNKRCASLLQSKLLHPECSIPVACGTPSQASAAYGLLANKAVTEAELSRVHHEQTRRRCENQGTILLVADTVVNGFGKDTKRTGLGPTTKGGIGFLSHVTLAVAENTHMPLGVQAHRTWVRPPALIGVPSKPADETKPATELTAEKPAFSINNQAVPVSPARTPPPAKAVAKALAKEKAEAKIAAVVKINAEAKAAKAALKAAKAKARRLQENRKDEDDPTLESARWYEQALATGKAMGAIPHVHVSDRESDDYKYLALLKAAGESFVARVSANRALHNGSDLFTEMDTLAIQICRSIHVGYQKGKLATPEKLAVATRLARDAKLEISAGTIEIYRPKRTPKSLEPSVTLNYVRVQEVEVPAGGTAVVWRLVTDLPIDTPEQIERIIDIYRARWTIEEFFKALKTGCAFSELQLESFSTLSKMLVLMLPVAWKLLEIRTVARVNPDAPATIIFTKRQLVILRALHDTAHAKKRLAEKPTVKQAMYAIASLVGHFPQNGDPGWLILGRGMRRLADAEADYLALRPHLAKLN